MITSSVKGDIRDKRKQEEANAEERYIYSINIDIIGKIEPASGMSHQYILCLMYQHTRWQSAVPLRSAKAKSACNALLDIFMCTVFTNAILSDCEANFEANLKEAFPKKISVALPSVLTPVSP